MGAEPVQLLQALILNGDSAASFLTYAENAQDAVLIGGKKKVSVWAQDSSATLQALTGYGGALGVRTQGLKVSVPMDRLSHCSVTSSEALSSSLRKNHFGIAELRWPIRLGQEENTPAGCSKRSPARPQQAKRRERGVRFGTLSLWVK